MTAVYRGVVVRVVRLNGRRSVIVWHGALKRVAASELEVLP